MLKNIAASIVAAFALAACATPETSLETQTRNADLATSLSVQGNFEVIASCANDGKAGLLSYAEDTNQYKVILYNGSKGNVSYSKPGAADTGEHISQLLDNLGRHCFPQ
jgi:hypothetical protein